MTSKPLRIAYVAKHQSGGMDDEGSISYALQQLGCRVFCIPEEKSFQILQVRPDVVLFHKWQDFAMMEKSDAVKVCWYFDKVEFNNREPIVRKYVDTVDLLFITDGTWAEKMDKKHIHVLRQGWDERLNLHKPKIKAAREVGFAGSLYQSRSLEYMKLAARVPIQLFQHHYREKFVDLCRSLQIMVTFTYPTDDNYWSNRVYNTLGAGGFLLHPYCEELTKEFKPNEELVYYRDFDDLVEKVQFYLHNFDQKEEIRLAGQNKTRFNYSYTDRCKTFLTILQKHIGRNVPKKG